MASLTCHVFGVAKQVRLERIVRRQLYHWQVIVSESGKDEKSDSFSAVIACGQCSMPRRFESTGQLLVYS